jgi:hypothetical protein
MPRLAATAFRLLEEVFEAAREEATAGVMVREVRIQFRYLDAAPAHPPLRLPTRAAAGLEEARAWLAQVDREVVVERRALAAGGASAVKTLELRVAVG